MIFFIYLFSFVSFFFAVFGLQSAHLFSLYGIQPNFFLVFSVAFVLFLPEGARGLLFLLAFQALFLLLLFFFFSFFVFETGVFFLLLLVLFWGRRFFSGTFGVDFFISLFLLFLYFVFLGLPHVSFQFLVASLLNFLLTFIVALVFWRVFFARGILSRRFFV